MKIIFRVIQKSKKKTLGRTLLMIFMTFDLKIKNWKFLGIHPTHTKWFKKVTQSKSVTLESVPLPLPKIRLILV